MCDNKGSTLTIIQSTSPRFLFGGYSPISWDSSDTDKNHPECFIFTLTNPHNIPPTKYPLKDPKDEYAIWCLPGSGPSFGRGRDIAVKSSSPNDSYTDFPKSYSDTTGKGDKTFTGALRFTTNEIEVYSVS